MRRLGNHTTGLLLGTTMSTLFVCNMDDFIYRSFRIQVLRPAAFFLGNKGF